MLFTHTHTANSTHARQALLIFLIEMCTHDANAHTRTPTLPRLGVSGGEVHWWVERCATVGNDIMCIGFWDRVAKCVRIEELLQVYLVTVNNLYGA